MGGVAAPLAVVTGARQLSAVTLTSPRPARSFSISAPPATYNLTYKIDTLGDEGQTTATEDVTIRRPFDGAVYSRDGAPPGGTEQWHAISNFGLYSDTTANTSGTGGDQPGSTTQVQKAIPQTALGDFRLDATLDDLVTATFVRAEARQVLGRNCQVYRTRQPGSFGTAAPTASDYTDACIDEAGLMLEEVSVQGERPSGSSPPRSPRSRRLPTPPLPSPARPSRWRAAASELNPIDASAVPRPRLLDPRRPPPPATSSRAGTCAPRRQPDRRNRYHHHDRRRPGRRPSSTATSTCVNADKTIIVTQGRPRGSRRRRRRVASPVTWARRSTSMAGSPAARSSPTGQPGGLVRTRRQRAAGDGPRSPSLCT